MKSIQSTSIELVEGANVFKQGENVTLGYKAYDDSGNEVDLTGKTLVAGLFGRRGIVYEAPATYSGGVMYFTLADEVVPDGSYQIEFTATSSTDADYRRKFPTSSADSVFIKKSTDDLGASGVSVITVTQLRDEQTQLQRAFESDIVPRVDELQQRVEDGVGAFTEDTEVKDARMDEINLRTFNQKVVAQLADKATIGEIKGNDLDISTDASKLKLINLSEEVKMAMAGTTPINATVANATLVNEKYAPKSVTEDKIAFMNIVSNNLVDMTKVLNGHTISGSTGAPFVSGSVNLLGFYPVKASTAYTMKFVSNYAFYRSDYSFISTASANVDTAVTITTPADCAYIKLVYYPAKPLVQLNEGSTLQAYDTYKIRLSDKVEQLSTSEIAKVKTIDTIKAKQETIFGSNVTQPAETSGISAVNMTLTKTNDLFNYQRLANQYGWFYKPSTKKMRFRERSSNYGHLVLAANGTNAVYLIYKGVNAGRVHNANFTTAPVLQAQFADVTPYTTAEGDELLVSFDSYIVDIKIKKVGATEFTNYLTMDLTAHKTVIDGLNKGLGISTLTSGSLNALEYNFVESIEMKADTLYKKMFDDANNSLEGAFASAIWTAMGDSITAWDSSVSAVFGTNYRDHVKQLLGIGTVHNRGIGSTMIARKTGYEFSDSSFVARYSNSIPTDSTIITVYGGTNDFGAGGGVPLGVNGSTDEFTFYGALRVLIEGLVAKFPDKKIGFFTPIYRTNHNVANAQGHVLKDYVDAIKIVCGEYGIPVLDLFRESGINVKNNATLLADGLHPNGTGQQFFSRKIAKFIDRL